MTGVLSVHDVEHYSLSSTKQSPNRKLVKVVTRRAHVSMERLFFAVASFGSRSAISSLAAPGFPRRRSLLVGRDEPAARAIAFGRDHRLGFCALPVIQHPQPQTHSPSHAALVWVQLSMDEMKTETNRMCTILAIRSTSGRAISTRCRARRSWRNCC